MRSNAVVIRRSSSVIFDVIVNQTPRCRARHVTLSPSPISPPVTPPMPAGADSAMLSVLANNRLNQLYGWEQFAAAILSQIEDPAPKAPRVADDYSG